MNMGISTIKSNVKFLRGVSTQRVDVDVVYIALFNTLGFMVDILRKTCFH